MGIGLINVGHTLEKYGGGMVTEETEDEFVVKLTIPDDSERMQGRVGKWISEEGEKDL